MNTTSSRDERAHRRTSSACKVSASAFFGVQGLAIRINEREMNEN